MSDIIDRLRDEGGYDPAEDLVRDPVCREAIDEIVALRCAMAAADERLRSAERRVWGDDRTDGCDAPDAMADEIAALRAKLTESQEWRARHFPNPPESPDGSKEEA